MEVSTILKANEIQQLKKVNISIDGEKTKQRLYDLWKSAPGEEREAIMLLSGLAKVSVQRAYKTGAISIKLVIATAQTLNVSPYYLTGESDVSGECTDEQLKGLLNAHGYEGLFSTTLSGKGRKKRAPQKEAVKADVEEVVAQPQQACQDDVKASAPADNFCHSLDATPEAEAFINAMTEEDMILLMRSILLRAKTGGENAEHARLLKLLLLR